MCPRTPVRNRCPRCWIHESLCFCPLIPSVATASQIYVVMHVHETKIATHTARLARECLPACQIRLRGRPGTELDTQGFAAEGRRTLLLYPGSEAEELNAEYLGRHPGPYNLIVPDGSWRQASKTRNREPSLRDVARVKLPPGPVSGYKLRQEPHPESLSTFEAIARALGVLEGAEHGPEVQRRLENIFATMVERALVARGKLSRAEFDAEQALEAAGV